MYGVLFWDVLLFYGALYLLCLVAITSKLWRPLHVLLQRPIAFSAGSCFGSAHVWTLGEVLVVGWFALLSGGWLWFWSGHKWGGNSVLGVGEPTYGSRYEQWARVLGQYSNLLMSLLLLPCARSSVWSKLLGVSWEVPAPSS